MASVLSMGASAMAGPGPRPKYIMINDTMMEITALTGDVTLDNGCKVCTNGAIVSRNGHVTKLRNGDIVSSAGEKMSPTALHGHGG